MKIRNNVPSWAIELIDEVCKDYHRATPTVVMWRRRTGEHSSGTTWTSGRSPYLMRRIKLKSGKSKWIKMNGEIAIRAGTDQADQKLVLLHELAHHLLGKRKREGHTARFWKLAYELYDRYGLDVRLAHEREKNYKAKAAIGFSSVLAKK